MHNNFTLNNKECSFTAFRKIPANLVFFTGLKSLVKAMPLRQGFSFYKSLLNLRMQNKRVSSYSVHQLHVHLVWSTKYRFAVLRGEVQKRCRDLIMQSCDSFDIQILKGVVSKDHVHLHISYPPKLSVSDIAKRLKGRSARILLEEFGKLRKGYWGGHFWGIGYYG